MIPSSLYAMMPMTGITYSASAMSPPTNVANAMWLSGAMPVKRVTLRPSAASATALPNSEATINAMPANGMTTMPITLMASTTNSTGTNTTVMSEATVDCPGCVSSVSTQRTTARSNNSAITT
jgi:hypothetical protein